MSQRLMITQTLWLGTTLSLQSVVGGTLATSCAAVSGSLSGCAWLSNIFLNFIHHLKAGTARHLA